MSISLNGFLFNVFPITDREWNGECDMFGLVAAPAARWCCECSVKLPLYSLFATSQYWIYYLTWKNCYEIYIHIRVEYNYFPS